MGRKAIPEKIKKKIYQEAGMLCPMCGERDVTTFQLHHIQPYSDNNEHDEENLILLCSNCHAKVTAGEILENEILRLKISLIKGNHPFVHSRTGGNVIHFKAEVNNGVVANKVEIKTQKNTVKLNAPQGTIGSSTFHRNYIKYLVDRYHEFKKADVGKEKMNYAIIYGAVKKKFGAKWDMVPIANFESLASYLQDRINKTILGKNRKSKGIKRYSTVDEYVVKHGY